MITAPLPNYNSFASIAAADSYHAARDNTAWAALNTAQKQAHLIKATDYIASHYAFKTAPVGETVEPALITATVLMAFYSTSIDLFAVGDSKIVTEESQTLQGVGSIEKTYSLISVDRFPMVTASLAEIASFNGSNSVKTGQMIK